MDIFRLDETDYAGLPSDRPRVIDKDLQEQFALIARDLDAKSRIMRNERRHDVAHDELLGQGREMDAADAREIGLHEVKRFLPGGAREIANGIEAPIDGIEPLVLACPDALEPALLVRGDRKDAPDVLVREIARGKEL